VSRIHSDVQRVLTDPEMQSYLGPQLLQPMIGSAQEFTALIKSDAQKWGTIIRNANLSLH